MGTKVSYTTVKAQFETWTVEFHDVTYDGAASEIEQLAGTGFEIEWNGDGAELYDTLVRGSSCKIFFNVGVTDEALDTFLQEIKDAEEQIYFIKIFRGASLFWVGEVLQDLNEFPDELPYTFTLTATCGLAKLSSIDYEYALNGSAPSHPSLLELIYNALTYCGNVVMYGDTDIFFISNIDWWEIDQRVTRGALVDTRINRLLLTNDIENSEPMDCLTALEEILKPFNAHIVMINGCWHILQPSAYQQTDITLWKYEKAVRTDISSTASLASKVDVSNANNIVPLHSALWEFRPGLKSTWVNVNFSSEAILEKVYDTTFFDENFTDIIAASDHAIVIEGEIEYEVQQVTLGNVTKQDGKPRLTMYIDAGDYRLTDVDPTNDDAGFVWQLNQNLFIFRDFPPAEGDEVQYEEFGLRIPPLPTGVTTIRIRAFMATVGGLCEPLLEWGGIIKIRQEIESGVYEKEVQYQADNDNYTTGSERAEISISYSDLNNAFSNNSVEIYNTTNTWVKSAEWAVGTSATEGIQLGQLLANTISGQQQMPILTLDARIYHGSLLNLVQCLYWRDAKLMFNGGRLIGSESIVDGQWIEIKSAGSGITDSEAAPRGTPSSRLAAKLKKLAKLNGRNSVVLGNLRGTVIDLEKNVKLLNDQMGNTQPLIINDFGELPGSPSDGDEYVVTLKWVAEGESGGEWVKIFTPK